MNLAALSAEERVAAATGRSVACCLMAIRLRRRTATPVAGPGSHQTRIGPSWPADARKLAPPRLNSLIR
jgi:hypothetical protein